jgi:hypothetical protein
VHILLDIPSHIPWRLIANHHAVDTGANWTFNPLVFSFKHAEAAPMNQVAAR